MRKWTHIILHHSLTKDSPTVSWQAIRRYHKEVRGWKDTGYHFGIELIEDEYEVLVGRPLTMIGCHCKGMNSKAIGICLVGNYDEKEPDSQMMDVLIKRLLIPLMQTFNIPIENIKGHNDYANKTCPGLMFSVNRLRTCLEGKI